jgi:hypothetical protein
MSYVSDRRGRVELLSLGSGVWVGAFHAHLTSLRHRQTYGSPPDSQKGCEDHRQ